MDTSVLFNLVKTGVLHLLSFIVQSHRRSTCFGCRVDHPSQTQHECLEVEREDFYRIHFHRLMSRLCVPKFIPTLQKLLRHHRVTAADETVKAVAETVLYQLREERAVADAWERNYKKARDEDLKLLTDSWTSASEDEA